MGIVPRFVSYCSTHDCKSEAGTFKPEVQNQLTREKLLNNDEDCGDINIRVHFLRCRLFKDEGERSNGEMLRGA